MAALLRMPLILLSPSRGLVAQYQMAGPPVRTPRKNPKHGHVLLSEGVSKTDATPIEAAGAERERLTYASCRLIAPRLMEVPMITNIASRHPTLASSALRTSGISLFRGAGTPWRLRANDILGRGGASKSYRESWDSITRCFGHPSVRRLFRTVHSANPALLPAVITSLVDLALRLRRHDVSPA